LKWPELVRNKNTGKSAPCSPKKTTSAGTSACSSSSHCSGAQASTRPRRCPEHQLSHIPAARARARSSTSSHHLSPGDCKGGIYPPRDATPKILTQVHKAHDHVRVVEESAVLRASQWGRTATGSRGQETLAVQGVCSAGRRLPELGRAGPSVGPRLLPHTLRCPILFVVIGQGVVEIQHEEWSGLQPPWRGLLAGRLLLLLLLLLLWREHRGLRLLETVQGPRPVREPQHRQDLLLHLPLLVGLEPPIEEARRRGLWRWLLSAHRAPAGSQQLPPGGGRGYRQRGPQWRGAAAAQQPPPPAQPLRPPPQPGHRRPARLPPRGPRGVERRSEAGARRLWPSEWAAPATSRRALFPVLALSPYLSWSSAAPPEARVEKRRRGDGQDPPLSRRSLEAHGLSEPGVS
jgi:hypothetical protein